MNRDDSRAKVRGDLIPRFSDVRRVPVRYHRTLPLAVIKRYQCVVLGSSAHTLTVGITAPENAALLHYLHVLTGATIFPVLIEPRRMRLLIARIERHQRFYECEMSYCTLMQVALVRLIMAFKER